MDLCAPASKSSSTSLRLVLPRTMESSTTTTLLPSITLGQRVELEPDAELAHPVRRLDESPADVAVLYEPFRVRDAAPLRVADGRHHPRVRDGDHHVSLGRSFLGEQLAHPVAGVCDLAPVEARVGTGEVHVLEDAERAARALGPCSSSGPRRL